MKTFYFSCRRVLWGLMVIVLAACSHDGGLFDENLSSNETETKNPVFTYTMRLNSEAPTYDGEFGTRSSTSWADGSTVYMYFNGIYGTAVYKKSTNTWTVTTKTSLSVTTTSTECIGVYAENLESETSTTIYPTALSPFYTGKGTYTYTASTGIIAYMNMAPKTWRLRFKGVSGTMITVSSSDVDVYKSLQKTNFANVSTESLSVTLTVGSDGYTPYIYGWFAGTTTNLAITLSTTEGTFTRTVDASGLYSAGASAYLNIPTEASHNNWEMAQTAKKSAVKPNYYVTLTDAIVTDFTMGDDVYEFTYYALSESKYKQFTSEDQLVDYIVGKNELKSKPVNYAKNKYAMTGLKSDTKYYLISFGKNSKGVRGEITVTPFTTKSESLPIAKITEVKTLSNSWCAYINLSNGAVSYFITNSQSYYNKSDCFFAYDVYKYMEENPSSCPKITSSYINFSINDKEYTTIITIAVDAYGNLGNPSIARATKSSSASQRIDFTRGVSERTMMCEKPSDLNFMKITAY